MTQISILHGVYVDKIDSLRTSLPRNMVPVPQASGISSGYLKQADGMEITASPGLGIDRGGINWNGYLYRVLGGSLVRIEEDNSIHYLGEVGGGGPVSMDYSFDRLAIASGGSLYYWDGLTLSKVTDPDAGIVLDMLWVDGYFMLTDGTFIAVTELNDPMSINPLKYGSSEADPDPVLALKKVRTEVNAINRYTIEVFQNVGGDNFPFQRIEGAQCMKGTIGRKTCAVYLEGIAFLGSGRNESPSVYIANAGNAQKIATREIDEILQGYTEAELATAIMDVRVDKAHQHLMIHLPDQTLVFDAAAGAALGEPVWFTLTSSIAGKGQYRARNLVWAYNQWNVGDPGSNNVGRLVDNISTHYGFTTGCEFGVPAIYNEGKGAVIHEMELVATTGGAALGRDPVIWTSYSTDGRQWSNEFPVKVGKIGETLKRIVWRRCGFLRNWRVQRFRGTSDSHIAAIRLELKIEALNG